MSMLIELTDQPAAADRDMATGPLLAFNAAFLGDPDTRPLAVLLRPEPEARAVGGLWGRTSFRWLFVELLFVPEAFRSRQLGTRLLELAEAEALRRDCLGVWLDTFSPAALGFYEKRGYRRFGEIADYPPGHARHFLLKRFAPPGLLPEAAIPARSPPAVRPA